jgi:hypothetical protein
MRGGASVVAGFRFMTTAEYFWWPWCSLGSSRSRSRSTRGGRWPLDFAGHDPRGESAGRQAEQGGEELGGAGGGGALKRVCDGGRLEARIVDVLPADGACRKFYYFSRQQSQARL